LDISNKGKKMMDVFISYSRLDIDFVDTLVDHLKLAGIEVWLDRSTIASGDVWRSKIAEGIDNCAKFAIVLSENSIESSVVGKELGLAENLGKEIIPILISKVSLPPHMRLILESINWIDFSADYIRALSKLLNSLNVEDVVIARILK